MSQPDRNDSRGRTYRDGIADERAATTVELHAPGNVVCQTSLLPEGDGFLIRAWPPNGVHEYGGTNITDFSCVLRVVGGHVRVESVRIDAYEPASTGSER